eukprot:4978748-Alexandrium_andersonii.AAC.1
MPKKKATTPRRRQRHRAIALDRCSPQQRMACAHIVLSSLHRRRPLRQIAEVRTTATPSEPLATSEWRPEFETGY